MPTTELGLKAAARGKKGPSTHQWHCGAWRGWESKQRSSRCSAGCGGLKSPTLGSGSLQTAGKQQDILPAVPWEAPLDAVLLVLPPIKCLSLPAGVSRTCA